MDRRSKDLRQLVVRMIEVGRRGHIGSAASLIEVLRVLYDSWLDYRVDEPSWSDRDRFILSKGHGCLALYAVLADKGFVSFDELDRFCSPESLLGGHPEIKVPGVEASTGALGHGFPIGVGMALAAKLKSKEYRVAVVVGDGEINEGSVWEAALCAGKHKLDNLTVMVDYNKHQSYASTFEVQDLEPIADKWAAFGFGVAEVDGHNIDQLRSVLKDLPVASNKPTAIICHTVKGKGIPHIENDMEWHHKNRIAEEEVQALLKALEG